MGESPIDDCLSCCGPDSEDHPTEVARGLGLQPRQSAMLWSLRVSQDTDLTLATLHMSELTKRPLPLQPNLDDLGSDCWWLAEVVWGYSYTTNRRQSVRYHTYQTYQRVFIGVFWLSMIMFVWVTSQPERKGIRTSLGVAWLPLGGLI